MRFEVLFSHSPTAREGGSVLVCNVIAIKKRTTKWLQLVDGALLAQLVRNYEHTIKWWKCSGQMIMSAALPMPTDWQLCCSDITTTTTWWLLLWLLVLLSLWTLRLSSLEWLPSLSDTRLSATVPSEKAMEEKSRRTAVSWLPVCLNVRWVNRGKWSPVQLGKSSWSALICCSSPTRAVSCLVSF